MATPETVDDVIAETWVPVVGWPFYEVSNMGRVRSLALKPGFLRPVPRILKLRTTERGYSYMTLSTDLRCKMGRVHRMVLEAFVGPCPEGYQAGHKNDVRSDNRLDNLEWITPQQNAAQMIARGRNTKGTQQPAAKFTDKDIADVRSLAGSVSLRELSERYGVSKCTIERIVNRTRWRHLP